AGLAPAEPAASQLPYPRLPPLPTPAVSAPPIRVTSTSVLPVARQAPADALGRPLERPPLPTMTMPGTAAPPDSERGTDYQIQPEPPGLERLTQSMASDPKLQERIRQESRLRVPNDRVEFPPSPILSRDTYQGRGRIWPGRQMIAEPSFVCYERLFFEEKNAERYGWDLGIVSPVLLAGTFYKDFVLFPMHAATQPCRHHEC